MKRKLISETKILVRILVILRKQPLRTLTKLASDIHISYQQIIKLKKKLINQGFLTEVKLGNYLKFTLTEKGKIVADKIVKTKRYTYGN